MSALGWLLVFIGGGLGSVARAALGLWLAPPPGAWPWHTWTANALGCLLAGAWFGGLDLARPGSPATHLRLLLLVGFCGGFTTFSAFALELWLAGEAKPRLALAYGATTLLVTVLAVGAGLALGRWLRG